MKKLTKLATIEFYFSPSLRKFFGAYETLDGKSFVVKIRRKLSLRDFLETLYHELTHIIICLLEESRIDTNVENLRSESGLVRVKIKDKEEEEICEEVSRKASKSLMVFFKKHASLRR